MHGYEIWQIISACACIAGIIFLGGGFFYLTKNHLKHIIIKLDKIDSRLDEFGERISRIEGRMEK